MEDILQGNLLTLVTISSQQMMLLLFIVLEFPKGSIWVQCVRVVNGLA